MINVRPIARVIAVLILMIGGLMLTGLPVSYYFECGDAMPLLQSGLICLAVGLLLWLFPFRGDNTIKKREGYLIVAVGWLAMVSFSMLPYLFSGVIPDIP
ncbi:MAG: TrkH family potassium uptake protein, partial [Phaeodactylibacter sp.]|nr:TrkH family potassium uptake protein [Phaeodactylibacter sp.]